MVHGAVALRADVRCSVDSTKNLQLTARIFRKPRTLPARERGMLDAGKPLRQPWRRYTNTESGGLMLSTILIIVLILLLIGALPSWPYSRSWGYGPTGGLGLIVVIVVVLVLLGYI